MKTYNVYFTRSHVRYNDYCVMLGVRAKNQKEACDNVTRDLYGKGKVLRNGSYVSTGFYPFNLCAVEYPMTDKGKAKLLNWCRTYGANENDFLGFNADGKYVGHVHRKED